MSRAPFIPEYQPTADHSRPWVASVGGVQLRTAQGRLRRFATHGNAWQAARRFRARLEAFARQAADAEPTP